MDVSRIKKLASLIETNTRRIDAYLNSEGLPSPSFDADYKGTSWADDTISESHRIVLESTDELHSLMLGPVGSLTYPSHNFMISLQAIYRFELATSFPEGKNEATFAEIAIKSGLDEPQVRRMLRHAMSYRIFSEPRKGVVAHTAASKLLASSPLMREWIGMVSEEMWPSATKTVDAIAKWPGSEEPNHAGSNIAHNTGGNIFDELQKHPEREKRYAAAMTWFSTGPGLESRHIIQGFAWDRIGHGLVVDVGGSHGSVSIAIAQKFPNIHCVVQDQPDVVAIGRKQLPLHVEKSVSFMEHDFFMDQPIKGADVYLLRWILHDWSDTYGIRILQALIPGLRRSSKLVICEYVLPEPGTMSAYQERALRGFDMAMLEFHNGKERDLDDWKDLLRQADPRFRIESVNKPKGSRLAIIEVAWEGDEDKTLENSAETNTSL